jgi:hypothetical protein
MLAAEALPSNPFDLFPEYGELATVSLLAFLAGSIIAGLLIATQTHRKDVSTVLDDALDPASAYVLFSAPVLVPWAGYEAWQTMTLGYGNVDTVSTALNLVLYVNLSLLPVILWNKDRVSAQRYWALLALIVLPRLLVSLGGQRFFVLQALIPIALWELSALRSLLTPRTIAIGIGALLTLFYVIPSIRGDAVFGLANVLIGSPLGFSGAVKATGVLDANRRSELVTCEIIAGTTSWDVCSLRSDFGVPEAVPARLDQATTYHVRQLTGLDAIGTGGNPIVEAYPGEHLSLGIAWFSIAGALLGWAALRGGESPLACYLFPHLAAKSIFLWRGSLAEYFERIPLILGSYFLLWAALRVLQGDNADRVDAQSD